LLFAAWLIISLLVVLGLVSITAVEPGISQIRAGAVSSLLSIFAFLILISFYVYQVPVEMHDERGGFVDEYFKLVPRPWFMRAEKDFPHTASITVLNQAQGVIKNCIVTVDGMTDFDGGDVGFSKEIKLCWTAVGINSSPRERLCQPQDLRKRLIVDVATTEPDNKEGKFTSWGWDTTFPVGKFKIYITVEGEIGGKLVSYPEVFDLEYLGENRIIINREGDDSNYIPNPHYLTEQPRVRMGASS